jgi:hypothetical protein
MKKKIKDFKEFNSSKTRISKVNDCLIFMLAMKNWILFDRKTSLVIKK